MNLQKAIKKDYIYNLKHVWLQNKEVSVQGLNHLFHLYGYKPIKNGYNYINIDGQWHITRCNDYEIKSWLVSKDNSSGEQDATLYPESDGLFLIFNTIIHTYGRDATSENIFTRKPLYVSADSIFNIKLETIGLTHQMIINYENNNQNKILILKFRGMMAKNWPIDKFKKEYTGKYTDNQPEYQHRMKQMYTNLSRYLKSKTFQDWTISKTTPSFINKIKSAFKLNVNTMESKTEFYQNTLIIMISTIIISVLGIVVNILNQLSSIDIQMIGIFCMIGLYFIILNIIRRTKEIRLDKYLQKHNIKDKAEYIKGIINKL